MAGDGIGIAEAAGGRGPTTTEGGDTTGGGVGLGQQSALLERSHCRADRGGADRNAEALDQCSAADRLNRVHIVMHRGLEHVLLPGGQWFHSVAGHGGIDLHTPGINSTLKVPHFQSPVLFHQPQTEVVAADSGVTQHHQRLFR